jgi:hypothetical protein
MNAVASNLSFPENRLMDAPSNREMYRHHRFVPRHEVCRLRFGHPSQGSSFAVSMLAGRWRSSPNGAACQC